jgi:hypothetical protein
MFLMIRRTRQFVPVFELEVDYDFWMFLTDTDIEYIQKDNSVSYPDDKFVTLNFLKLGMFVGAG